MINRKISYGILIVLAALLIGGVFLYKSKTKEVFVPEPKSVSKSRYIPQIINAKHQFKNGVHTIVGEVDLPTSCYLLDSNTVVEVREPNVDLATIRFTTTGDREDCTKVVAPARFKEVFNAQKDAEIIATWNDEYVRLNLIEAGPNEDLDNFELFIKG